MNSNDVSHTINSRQIEMMVSEDRNEMEAMAREIHMVAAISETLVDETTLVEAEDVMEASSSEVASIKVEESKFHSP